MYRYENVLSWGRPNGPSLGGTLMGFLWGSPKRPSDIAAERSADSSVDISADSSADVYICRNTYRNSPGLWPRAC